MTFLALLISAIAWVGHACAWTAVLNNLYGRPISKHFLVPWRAFTGLVIVSFPLLAWWVFHGIDADRFASDDWLDPAGLYFAYCLIMGGIVFPAITIARNLRPLPSSVLSTSSTITDYYARLGKVVFGSGKWEWAAHLPFNDCFRVETTEHRLAITNLPPEWEGLTILFVSDVHLYGSPGRAYFDAVFADLAAGPTPDLVFLGGDYLDTDHEHHGWLVPLLQPLQASQGKYAVLGNHDKKHDPERIRAELTSAGYVVLGNRWQEITIRGVRCTIVGHEGPWFHPGPDLSNAPKDQFRLCISHSPDQYYWGAKNGIGLMLCGHVHGGQIRVPIVGSIFVPSIYGRRFDQGIFQRGALTMVVGRGLSGKEPMRFACPPQILRLTLTRGTSG